MAHLHDAFSHDELVSSAGADLLNLMWKLRQTANHAFEPLGFTSSQAALLLFIRRGCTSPNELAKLLDIHRTAVSALLRGLEERALIKRFVEPDDKRRVEIKMTASGVEAVASIEQAWQNANTPNLARLAEEELRGLIEVCRKVLRAEPS